MNIYSQKRSWKLFLVTFAFVIVVVSLWYTNRFLNNLALEEQRQIRIWAKAISQKAELVNYTEHLFDDFPINCDVLVTGKGKSARLEVLQLVTDAGMRGWDAGVIENSAVVEGLTSLLIYINKQNKVKSAGIKITGV